MEGVLSHEMNRFIIDANKAVLNRPTADQKASGLAGGRKLLGGSDNLCFSTRGLL